MVRTNIFLPRLFAVWFVGPAGGAATLYAIWSIVPFFTGDLTPLGAHVIHYVALAMNYFVGRYFGLFGLAVPHDMGWMLYYVFGVFTWVFLTGVVMGATIRLLLVTAVKEPRF